MLRFLASGTSQLLGAATRQAQVGQLAGVPRPPESFPCSSPDCQRLRDGRYRITYDIDEAAGTVSVCHLARGSTRE